MAGEVLSHGVKSKVNNALSESIQKAGKPGYDKLLRRNQFLIGPKAVSIDGWKTFSFTGFHVVCHPDLNVEKFTKGSVELLLFGNRIPELP